MRASQEGDEQKPRSGIANTPDASSKGGKRSGSGGGSTQPQEQRSGSGGNRAQKQRAGRKGGQASS